MIQIDGSQGEGGGQIVRSSLALSAVTGKPVTITNVRAGRRKPGLRKQHVVAVNAISRIANAFQEGAAVGSDSVTFQPNPINHGHYEFDIGSAGSTSLVAQTVLPALMLAAESSTLIIRGGTHNPMAPTFDFLRDSFLPQLNHFGARVDPTISSHGFYPAGGGEVRFEVTPSPQPTGWELMERGELKSRSVTAIVSQLPAHIGQREVDQVCKSTGWKKRCANVVEIRDPRGPGNVLSIALEFENVTTVFTGMGERGITAEKVATRLVKEVDKYLQTDAVVNEYLSDQILLPMALAASHGCSSRFDCVPLSEHSRTHIDIIGEFLDVRFNVSESGGRTIVTVSPHPEEHPDDG